MNNSVTLQSPVCLGVKLYKYPQFPVGSLLLSSQGRGNGNIPQTNISTGVSLAAKTGGRKLQKVWFVKVV